MRKLIVVLLVLVASGTASAQYAAPPPAPPSSYPQQYPPQQYPQQQPYGYQRPQPMPVQLTVDEQWLLSRGYISDGQHIGGGIASLFFGFGIGQAVQGRWSEKGYIFTIGEGASFGAMLWGITELVRACDDSFNDPYGETTCNHSQENRGATLLIGGLIGISVFRIWEIVDAFAGPSEHNAKVRALHMRLGMRDGYALKPFVVPAGAGGGGVAGVGFRF
jgi:hypothetical protein